MQMRDPCHGGVQRRLLRAQAIHRHGVIEALEEQTQFLRATGGTQGLWDALGSELARASMCRQLVTKTTGETSPIGPFHGPRRAVLGEDPKRRLSPERDRDRLGRIEFPGSEHGRAAKIVDRSVIESAFAYCAFDTVSNRCIIRQRVIPTQRLPDRTQSWQPESSSGRGRPGGRIFSEQLSGHRGRHGRHRAGRRRAAEPPRDRFRCRRPGRGRHRRRGGRDAGPGQGLDPARADLRRGRRARTVPGRGVGGRRRRGADAPGSAADRRTRPVMRGDRRRLSARTEPKSRRHLRTV